MTDTWTSDDGPDGLGAGGELEITGDAPSDPPVITASGGLRLATLGATDG